MDIKFIKIKLFIWGDSLYSVLIYILKMQTIPIDVKSQEKTRAAT